MSDFTSEMSVPHKQVVSLVKNINPHGDNSLHTVYTLASKLFFFNFTLRMVLEGYIEFAITSLINLHSV